MAKHTQASRFISKGVFDGLKNFAELEKRISALPLEKERGDAFEVFAEAYLATQPICQAKVVWPQTSAPSQLLKKLGLPISKDMGTDGLVELKDGRIASYQAKFYTGRPLLNWSILSTFFAISDRVSHTIIFTNSDTLASTIEQRHNFIAIRGVDLDRLTPADFSIIEKWLKGKPVARVIPKPRPHQEKALDDLLPALKSSDRATVIMACGTGKTLLSLWAAERLGVKNVLVLVPSLALIQQTLHGWLAATGWDNLAYLCVCSDPTITDGADELVVKKSDLDFEVTTSPTEVKRFLESKFNGVKVVFSTYMSAGVVGQALNGRKIFDLGLFDEAHKTAGREGKAYAFALSDDNLPLKKRIFMTATPRHYNVLKRDKEGDAKLVYSMDVPESYGSVVHKLPFAEAARARIICRYKVLISVVTSEMVGTEMLKRGKVLVKGDEIHAQQVANQLALAAAVEKHGVGKIITFHKNIKSAQSFTSPGPEGISNHLKDFSVFHVNGSMPSAEREKLMGEFKNSKHGLISNAKCLTEGVDVPAVDMVAFLNPKRSTVDIVQATGRAMRKAPGKEVGYILVPLYLETKKGETIEEAVQRGKFDEVWDVLAALQEQDEVLAEIIRQMREERGRTKGYNDTRFRGLVEVVGTTITLDSLQSAITTTCINNLGDNWDERFGELVAFKNVFGHTNVPMEWDGNPVLGRWCSKQRSRVTQLTVEQVKKLTSIGFIWNRHAAAWEEGFESLCTYKLKHGDCLVPDTCTEDTKLATWVGKQRQKKNSLSREQVERLNGLGFVWNPYKALWEQRFAALVEYKKKFGHCRVPAAWAPNPELGRWVCTQRRRKKMLPVDYIRRLNGIGFEWDHDQTRWREMYCALVKFKERHGHCRVPCRWVENPALATWVGNQRHRKHKLSVEQVKALTGIGFEWNPFASAWEEHYLALVMYKKVHGDCLVSQQYAQDNLNLGRWVSKQRQKKSGLSKEQIVRLEKLGFEWNPINAVWESNFRELVKYQKLHGNCCVPSVWPENPKLGTWVAVQRRNKSKMSQDLVQRLYALVFDWDYADAIWEKRFKELIDYKMVHGDCNVPREWPSNPVLATWVKRQRFVHSKEKMPKEKVRRLTEIGFEWKLK